jgi:hypothetical protein
MLLFKGRQSRRALSLALLGLLVLAPACRTTPHAPLFTATGPGWHVQEGQALWRPRQKMPELAGDLVMASHEDGRSLVQFTKTPLPMMLAQTTRTNWLIQFPPQRLSFSGRGRPSTRFLWLYLKPALSGEPLPAGLVYQRKPDGGWRLENRRTGESVEGVLSP